MSITPPKGVLAVLEELKREGIHSFVVGGGVRDMLLGKAPKDWDVAAAAEVSKLSGVFPESRLIGEKYGVLRVERDGIAVDIASMRIDGRYSDHRRPDEVILTDNIEEDLARRDFTMNGIAYSPEEGLIDPFDGQRDITARMVRAIGKSEDRFVEDPLRILRALRFCAQLGFDIALETFTSMQKTVGLLKHISVERKREEFDRLLVGSYAGKALRMCVAAGVMPFLLGDDYPPKGEREEQNFAVLMKNLDRANALPEVRRTMFFCCIEKHKALQAAKRLGIEGESLKRLARDIGILRELLLAEDREEIKTLASPLGRKEAEEVRKIMEEYVNVFGEANPLAESRLQLLSDILESGEPVFLQDLAVNGEDLLAAGFPEGREIGELLDRLLKKVHRDPKNNEKEKLIKSILPTPPTWRERFFGNDKNRR